MSQYEQYRTYVRRLCPRSGPDELQLHRLAIVVDIDNHRSQCVAEKVGATREGLARHHCKSGDTWRDAFMFSLLPIDLGDNSALA